jgi:hypothetical protein
MTEVDMSAGANHVPDPDSVREEAERLVAAGLAAVSMAADRIGAPARERGGAAAAGFDALGDMLFGPSAHRRHTVATDSEACCRCPVCRVIAAARRPDPDLAERLATGAGDVAEGAVRLLRTVVGDDHGGRDRDDHWSAATAREQGPTEGTAEQGPTEGTAEQGPPERTAEQ